MIELTSPLIQKDRSYVWHPFTQAKTAANPIPIVSGKGVYLYAEDGSRYLDAISSWWVNLHGHAHPYIAQKIGEQAYILEHIIFTDFTHYPGVLLAERLLKLLPANLAKVFYSDNGSTAVETALKMVLQYVYHQDSTYSKTKIVCFKGAYHGDTFGAMSVASKNAFNQPFWPFLFDVVTIDTPQHGQEERSIEQLKAYVEKGDVAAFIFEPLIQGVAGMVSHSLEGLDSLITICQSHDVLTIADEVMTGFGRTGPLFVSSQLKSKPDIICLAKGLTGGFLPLAVTVCTQQVFDKFLDDDRHKAFLHGHSYCANPLACTAALANLDLLELEVCTQQRLRIQECHQRLYEQWNGHPRLKRCEVWGTILALEYHTGKESSYFHPLRDRLSDFFIEKKVILRPFGNTLHVLPPYCIEEPELNFIAETIALTLQGDDW